jgi:hypothetical protein
MARDIVQWRVLMMTATMVRFILRLISLLGQRLLASQEVLLSTDVPTGSNCNKNYIVRFTITC